MWLANSCGSRCGLGHIDSYACRISEAKESAHPCRDRVRFCDTAIDEYRQGVAVAKKKLSRGGLRRILELEGQEQTRASAPDWHQRQLAEIALEDYGPVVSDLTLEADPSAGVEAGAGHLRRKACGQFIDTTPDGLFGLRGCFGWLDLYSWFRDGGCRVGSPRRCPRGSRALAGVSLGPRCCPGSSSSSSPGFG
jgi:hypothetical protein